ncbi:MAG: hypothetical protein ACRCSK_06675, partial [Fusobacteriaceae bacterium]
MIYFIQGEGTPFQLKYEETLSTIKKQNPGVQEKYFDFSQDESGNFLVKVSQNSMFGGKEIFVVKRFEQLKNPDKFIKSLGEFSLAEKDV